MASAATLYSPQVLALATGLALRPLTEAMPLRGEARSQSCGSTIELGLSLDPTGGIASVGIRAHACAIGQASAAIFANAAAGRTLAELIAAESGITAWLSGGPMPDWPGLDAIAPAIAFPGRHGAILLAWRAAIRALSYS